MKRSLGLLTLLLGLGSAQADSEYITIDRLSAGKNITVTFTGHSQSVWAGQIEISFDNGGRMKSFSTDVEHAGSVSQRYQVEQRLIGTLSGGREASYLYETYGRESLTNKNEAAALQLAIWDLVNDHGDGLSAGSFCYTGSLATMADNFIAEALEHPLDFGFWQDASPSGPNRGPSVIGHMPEPASLLMGLAGGLGLLFARRRLGLK